MTKVTRDQPPALMRAWGTLEILGDGHTLHLRGPMPSLLHGQDKHPISTPISPQCLPANTSYYMFLQKEASADYPVPRNTTGQCWEDFYVEMDWPQSWGAPCSPLLVLPSS